MTERGDYEAKFGTHLETRYDVLFNRNIFVKLARRSYITLFHFCKRRKGVGTTMPPRLPLEIDHHF